MIPEPQSTFDRVRQKLGETVDTAERYTRQGLSSAWSLTKKGIDTAAHTIEQIDNVTDRVDKTAEQTSEKIAKKAFELADKESGETGEKAGRVLYRGAQIAIAIKGMGIPVAIKGALKTIGGLRGPK